MLGSRALNGSLARYPRGRLILVALGLFAVGVAGMVLSARMMSSSSAFEVAITNDLADSVMVGHCSGSGRDGEGACDSTDGQAPLGPGQHLTTMGSAPGSNPFVVRAASGEILGCLPLAFTERPTPALTVLVSEAAPCGLLVSRT